MRARRLVQLIVTSALAAGVQVLPAVGASATATVVHVPPAHATYHEDLVVEATAQCETDCTATLYHKAVDETPSPLATFTAQAMTPAGGDVHRATIPAADVDTRGVEYLVAVDDGGPVTWWPAAPVAPELAVGFRVRVPEPPHVVHAPVATAYRGQAIALEATANCVHDACVGTVEWRTTGHGWSTATMVAGPRDATTGAMAFTVTLPSEASTTEGVDYRIRVSDGHVADVTPDHHVTVLTPTAVIHQPVVTALYGQPIPVEAVVACAATCAVELSYRTTGAGTAADTGEWRTVPMVPLGQPASVAGATAVQRWYYGIPASDVTTRGIDYRIRATDGSTTAHSPGTAYVGTTAVQSDGVATYWFHVHVAEPVRLVHVPVVRAAYRETITITAHTNCATGRCTASLGYRTSTGLDTVAGVLDYAAGGPAFTETPMTVGLVKDVAPAGQLLELTGEIPAEVVDTNGVDYWIRVTDGDTTAWFPGTSYVGGLGSIDGTRAAWQHVEVSTRPVVHHVPATHYTQGVPRPIVATAVVGTPTPPTATLWVQRSVETTYEAVPMTVTPTAVGTYDLAGAIPASLTALGAPIEYVIEVHDGHQRGFAPLTAAAPVEPMAGYLIVVNAPVPFV